MEFDIHPGSPDPIYRQIVDQVRRQVASGRWRSGDELPSVRTLAARHAINPMTVSKAYGLLEADGLIERRRGLAMQIAAQPVSAKDRMALLEPVLVAAARQAVELGLSPKRVLSRFERCMQDLTPQEAQGASHEHSQ